VFLPRIARIKIKDTVTAQPGSFTIKGKQGKQGKQGISVPSFPLLPSFPGLLNSDLRSYNTKIKKSAKSV